MTDEATTKVPAKAGRTSLGRFGKGNRMGKGRPPGAKNKATLAREEMEAKGTLMVARKMPHILKKALAMAEDGDKEMIKMILKDTVFKNGDGGGGGNTVVNVEISNMTAPEAPPATIINVTPEE